MSHTFETMGNATVVVFEDGHPVVATDPWLVGTCYFGSWALDHKLSADQTSQVIGADYIWISHGHPDHLHEASLRLLPQGKPILVPDHYNPEIASFLREFGFDVRVLPYRTWFQVSPTVRVMCMDNINQDAILVIEAGDALIIDLNDSPLCGELDFLRKLVRSHAAKKSYLLALCSIDADMFNFVDDTGRQLAGAPDERKPGAVWNVARTARRLGVGTFCCSSSQHIYARDDSVWANPYRIGWADIQRYWTQPKIRLVEPFVTVDVDTGTITRNHPTQQSDPGQVTGGTGEDDWAERLSNEEWSGVETFIRKFELVRRHVEFIEVTVGGETRHFDVNPTSRRPADKRRGVVFIVPRQSLMTTVTYGYLDDLLIGNFMRVRLINTHLYPRFTPLVAKVGGNAKVYTKAQYRRFLWRYIRRNPIGTLGYRLDIEFNQVFVPWLRDAAERLGVKRPLKYLYRRILGDVARAEKAP